jgi:trans-aconitate methyltransferase
MGSTQQIWDPQGYARHASFVPALGVPVLQLLDPQPGEQVLDLGCGDGVLTQEIVARGAVVVGVDASPSMVEAARARGLDACVMAGEALAFAGDFDAVFSNAALHWMRDAEAVIAGVARALRPGGRFVGEFGGHGNVAAIVVALTAAAEELGLDAASLHPWFFPTPAAYARHLERGGFTVETIDLIPRPTSLPSGLAGWLETFAGPFLTALLPAERGRFLARVEALAATALKDEEGGWTADYVRLRFRARRAG